MKQDFVSFQYNADPKDNGGAGSNIGAESPITAVTTAPSALVSELLKKNAELSSSSTTAVIPITVKSIGNWRPTKTGLEVLIVVTDQGNFFPLANVVKNQPKSFTKPVVAKATLVPRKDANGIERLNMAQLEFEPAMDNQTRQMISAMPAGTALFAKA